MLLSARKRCRRLATWQGQAREGIDVTNPNPPPALVDALTKHYTDLYQLGQETVRLELAKQRRDMGKQLDDPANVAEGAVAAGRLDRARQRGEHSARQIVNAVSQRLGRAQISGLLKPDALQTAAEQAATGQLHLEALTNAAASINDGRNDAGSSAPDVVGAIYTSVMDERACDPCIAADTGAVLPPDEALALGPPNPDCAGGDRCRCMLVWVLSDDPAAATMLDAEDQVQLLLRALDERRTPPTPPKPKRTRKKILRDEDGQMTGIEEEEISDGS